MNGNLKRMKITGHEISEQKLFQTETQSFPFFLTFKKLQKTVLTLFLLSSRKRWRKNDEKDDEKDGEKDEKWSLIFSLT